MAKTPYANRIGEVVDTNCGPCRILQLVLDDDGKSRFVVQFLTHKYRGTYLASSVLAGKIKNPYYPSVCGVGYLGVGPHRAYGVPQNPDYVTWVSMLKRCYGNQRHKLSASYEGCTVSTAWHNFQTFASDIRKKPNYKRPNFSLDKDLTIIGNREYSNAACNFIPDGVNSFLATVPNATGVVYSVRKCADSPYRVRIKIAGRTVSLGSYVTEYAALSAYQLARARHVRDMAKTHRADLPRKVYKNLLTIATNMQAEAKDRKWQKAIASQQKRKP